MGTQACDAACNATCDPPTESCNALDDDCDGVCDGMDGCRRPVHRAVGPVSHFYSTDLALAGSGHTVEAVAYFHVYAAETPGLVALHRCDRGGGRFFLTTSATCEAAGSIAETLGYVSPEPRCDSTPLYRLYNGGADRHFYTVSAAEHDSAVANIGYRSEGIHAHVWMQP
jgi:hypothetical protein